MLDRVRSPSGMGALLDQRDRAVVSRGLTAWPDDLVSRATLAVVPWKIVVRAAAEPGARAAERRTQAAGVAAPSCSGWRCSCPGRDAQRDPAAQDPRAVGPADGRGQHPPAAGRGDPLRTGARHRGAQPDGPVADVGGRRSRSEGAGAAATSGHGRPVEPDLSGVSP